jgi:uncharacterized protein YodC (DUF2158 family)
LFKRGDIVVMKSGGPPMTVDKVPGDMAHEYATKPLQEYHCEWFKGASAQQGEFAEHLLEKYEPPKR